MRPILVWAAALLAAAPGPSLHAADERLVTRNRQAWEAFQRRDFAKAESLAREAWALAGSQEDATQAAVAAANVGAARALRGHLDEAFEWSRRAEERLGPAGDRQVLGRLLAAQAVLQLARGNDDESRRAFARAEAPLGPDDWRLGVARAITRLYVDLDMAAATTTLEGLLEEARRPGGDPARALPCLLALGWIEGLTGEGSERYDEARVLLEGRDDGSLLALVDHGLGALHLRGRRPAKAEAAIRRGLGEARRAGDLRLEYVLLDDLSLLQMQKREDVAARETDMAAQQRLGVLAQGLREGRLEDSLLLDFRHLSRLRFLNQASMLMDPFIGVLDQLAVKPPPAEAAR